MKKLFLTLIAIAALIFNSCSNKVDLYSYDGDTTIVYAMLDASLDTNFFKITHSFLGDATQLAHDYDANNYKYDEIEVTLSGNFVDDILPNGTIVLGHYDFTLDTISKWIPYDPNSQFYSGCYQTYYYVTKTMAEGQEYTINVLRKEDNVNVTAKTKTINSFRINKPLSTSTINFNIKKYTMEWSVPDPSTLWHTTAAYFEITGYFHYKELMPGATDTVHQTIRWSLGSDKAENLVMYANNMVFYAFTFSPEGLFGILDTDTYLREHSPMGVQRFFDKFEFEITAIGEELYNYHIVTTSSSAIQDVPNYSNVENGMGLMSSRISKKVFNTINILARVEIHDRFPQYGFELPLY